MNGAGKQVSNMPSYSKNEIVLVRYPFSDLTSTKVRPAVIVNAPHVSQDVLIVPLTSKKYNEAFGNETTVKNFSHILETLEEVEVLMVDEGG